jgi:outer membrane lipoprotein-sorting protein
VVLGLLVGAVVAVLAAFVGQRSSQAQAPGELSNAELLARVAEAGDDPPQLSATVTVEQDLLSTQLLNSLGGEGGEGGAAALSGAQNARVWYGGEDRLRAELLGENGDRVFVRNSASVSVYDGAENTLRTGEVEEPAEPEGDDETVDPAEINELLARLGESSDLVQTAPTTYEGRGSYVLTLTPKDADSTLVNRVETVIDSETYLPLSLSLFADGTEEPVLYYRTSGLTVGPVADERFAFETPPGAEVLPLDEGRERDGGEKGERNGERREGSEGREVETVAEAEEAVGFDVRELAAAPGGRALTGVYLAGSDGVVLTYGEDWGTVVLAQTPEEAGVTPERTPEAVEDGMGGGISLPTVDVNGVEAQELSTPVGTALAWSDGGVSYVLVGSVPAAELEQAARGLR